jgi:hypothetical protein
MAKYIISVKILHIRMHRIDNNISGDHIWSYRYGALVLYKCSVPYEICFWSEISAFVWPQNCLEDSSYINISPRNENLNLLVPIYLKKLLVRTKFDWSWAGGPVLWVVRTKFDWSWAGGPVLWVVRTKFDWSWAGGPVLWVVRTKFDWSWAGGPVLWVVWTKFDWSWAGGPMLWAAHREEYIIGWHYISPPPKKPTFTWAEIISFLWTFHTVSERYVAIT